MCTKNFRSIGAGIVEKIRHKAVLSSFFDDDKTDVFWGEPCEWCSCNQCSRGGYIRPCTCKSWAISVQIYLRMAMKCKFVGMFIDEPKDIFLAGVGGLHRQAILTLSNVCVGVLEGMHMRSLN